MVTQWMILASVVSLALGSALKEDGNEKHDEIIQKMHELNNQQQEIPISVKCCKSERVLPALVTQIKFGCLNLGQSLYNAKNNEEKLRKGCELIGCLLEKKNLIEEGKPVNEQLWRSKFLDKVSPVTEPIVQAALDDCFDEYKKMADKANSAMCPGKIGAEQLYGCIASTVVVNCPQSMWHSWTKPHCREAMKKTGNKQ